jgi:hypothetical protein
VIEAELGYFGIVPEKCTESRGLCCVKEEIAVANAKISGESRLKPEIAWVSQRITFALNLVTFLLTANGIERWYYFCPPGEGTSWF